MQGLAMHNREDVRCDPAPGQRVPPQNLNSLALDLSMKLEQHPQQGGHSVWYHHTGSASFLHQVFHRHALNVNCMGSTSHFLRNQNVLFQNKTFLYAKNAKQEFNILPTSY